MQAEMSCVMAGGIAAGVYPTDTKEQLKYARAMRI